MLFYKVLIEYGTLAHIATVMIGGGVTLYLGLLAAQHGGQVLSKLIRYYTVKLFSKFLTI